MPTSHVVHPMVPASHAALVPPLLLIAGRFALAQPSSSTPSSPSDNYNPYFGAPSFNPTMAMIIVFLVTAFLFVAFLSIYIRYCAGGGAEVGPPGSRSPRLLRLQSERGLSLQVLESFPTLVYAEVKELRLDKGALECAVCLCEFEDEDALRLLPPCSHVFHPDCIGAWLASHVTCPVCRTNLAGPPCADAAADPVPSPAAAADCNPAPVPHSERREQELPLPNYATAVVIEQAPGEDNEELAKMSKQRTTEAVSLSTGHSEVPPGENVERYTLRLPEHVLREIFAARKLRRSASCLAYSTAEEGSSRRVPRGAGDASIRGFRGVRFGRSERWPSFFIRTLSAKVPERTMGRRADAGGGDESAKKWESEGTSSGRSGAVRTPFNCLGGGASDKDESSVAPLSERV